MAHNVQVITATTQLKIEAGAIHGILCTNAGTSGTITIYDSPDGDTNDKKIINTLTLTAGANYLLNDCGARCEHGIYIVLANSPVVTVLYS